MAFREERALPSGVMGPLDLTALAAEAPVTGPRDSAPLARAAAIWRGDLMLAPLWQARGGVYGVDSAKR